jgi:hypothetical protein
VTEFILDVLQQMKPSNVVAEFTVTNVAEFRVVAEECSRCEQFSTQNCVAEFRVVGSGGRMRTV